MLISCIFFSCWTNNKVEQEYNAHSDCLKLYKNCDGVYMFDSSHQNLVQNLIYGTWMNRQENYQVASDVLKKIKLRIGGSSNNELINDVYSLERTKAWYNLNFPKIPLLDCKINECFSSTEINSILYLLNQKANILFDEGEVNYALATTFYSEYLREQYKDKLHRDPYYLSFFQAALLFDKNKEVESARYFYSKALENALEPTPQRRKLEVYSLLLDRKVKNDELEGLIQQYIVEDEFPNDINDNIETTIYELIEDPQTSAKVFRNILESKDSTRNKSFDDYNKLYLADDYISLGKIDSAYLWLGSVNREVPIFDYLVNTRFQKILYYNYQESGNTIYLRRILDLSKTIYQNYQDHSKSVINLHYADALFDVNSIYMAALYELHQLHQIDDQRLAQILSDVKQVYSKISDIQSILGRYRADDFIYDKVANLKYKIERLELKTNRYRDTLLQDYAIYDTLYHLHKELYDIKSTLPQKTDQDQFSLNTLKYSLRTGDKIIDILKTKEHYYITSFDKKESKMEKWKRSQIEEALKEYKKSILDKENTDNPSLLSALFETHIDNQDKHVVIVPDGYFFEVPIDHIQLAGIELIDKVDISYSSNISTALESNKNNSINSNIVSWSYSSTNTLNSSQKLNIEELEVGMEECEEINILYDTSKLVAGFELTKSSWSHHLDSEIIHISSHSSSSLTNILDNYVFIRDEKGQEIPLYGFEIKHQDLTDKLVILSSCNSGTGKQKDGTGVFSLSRDMFQAGAQTVIKSLWKVDERSTKDLMVEFHSNFNKGQTAGEALSFAKRKIKMSTEFSAPYYWAGFVIEGNKNLTLKNTSK